MTLAEILIRYMAEHKLNVRTLAKRAGIPEVSIRTWVNGAGNASYMNLDKLKRVIPYPELNAIAPATHAKNRRSKLYHLCGDCKKWIPEPKRTGYVLYGICKKHQCRTERCTQCLEIEWERQGMKNAQ